MDTATIHVQKLQARLSLYSTCKLTLTSRTQVRIDLRITAVGIADHEFNCLELFCQDASWQANQQVKWQLSGVSAVSASAAAGKHGLLCALQFTPTFACIMRSTMYCFGEDRSYDMNTTLPNYINVMHCLCHQAPGIQ